MTEMLHITNGSSTLALFEAAGIEGMRFSWDDFLHEGPVSETLTLEALSDVRARFIGDCGFASFDVVRERFRQRDQLLKNYHQYKEVILWFEHDLYDQLQLLQLLDWFADLEEGQCRLSLIQSDIHLGKRPPADYRQLLNSRVTVSVGQLRLAARAWSAFRQPGPNQWKQLLFADTGELKFLADSVLRQLEQYPAPGSGLNRTERQILQVLRDGPLTAAALFRSAEALEAAAFMGDWQFWIYLNRMLRSDPPLIAAPGNPKYYIDPQQESPGMFQQSMEITAVGLAVLEGKKDWTRISSINRWIGGVHLTPGSIWRWDGSDCFLDNF